MMNTKEESPEGLRVLLVDDNVESLELLGKMLQDRRYHVTKCKGGEEALCKLCEKKDGYNMVMAAAHMSKVDGFQLLHRILDMELGLPVALFSNKDETEDLVKKALAQGAFDFIIKPNNINIAKPIWQHFFRKKTFTTDTNFQKHSISQAQHQEYVPGEVEKEEAKLDMSNPRKKSRFVWTPDLRGKFNEAVNRLGFKDAVPKNILAYMQKMDGVPASLNKHHISSHLQKFRQQWKKNNEHALTHSQSSSSTILPPPAASHSLVWYGTKNDAQLGQQQVSMHLLKSTPPISAVSQPNNLFHNQVPSILPVTIEPNQLLQPLPHPGQPSHGFRFGYGNPQATMNCEIQGTVGMHIPNYASCSRERLVPQQQSTLSMSEFASGVGNQNNFSLKKESFGCGSYYDSVFTHDTGLQPIFAPSPCGSSNQETIIGTFDDGNHIGDTETTQQILESFFISDPYFQQLGHDSLSQQDY